VAELCRKLSLKYVTPENPNTPEWLSRIRECRPDIIFSFYYRFMISKDILEIPPYGAYNLHGSLLPAYRGRAPVNWVIIRGEETTGVTLHEMVVKPDAGPIVAQAQVKIAPDDTPVRLFAKLEEAAARMLDEVLPGIREGRIPKREQDLSRGSYFGGRKPEDGRISWGESARNIYNLIRGVTRPYPGAFGFLKDEKVLFWWAAVREGPELEPGEIAVRGETVLIGTACGVLVPSEIEVEGKVYTNNEIAEYFEPHKGECMT
jgi:methionyl-tRNA formyltransferase